MSQNAPRPDPTKLELLVESTERQNNSLKLEKADLQRSLEESRREIIHLNEVIAFNVKQAAD